MKSINERSNTAAYVVIDRKRRHVATVQAFYSSGGAVQVDVHNHGTTAQMRCLETALRTGRLTPAKVVAAEKIAPEYYVTPEARREHAAYQLFDRQSSKACGYGYDKFASALSGMLIDGHTIANHCGSVPEDEAKRAAMMRAYIRDAKAGWKQGGTDSYKYWNDKVARIGCRFSNHVTSYAEAEENARRRYPEMSDAEIKEWVGMRGNYSPDVSRMSSLYFVQGLDRLATFGYQVIKAI